MKKEDIPFSKEDIEINLKALNEFKVSNGYEAAIVLRLQEQLTEYLSRIE